MQNIPASESTCPIDLALHILGNKWSIPILRDLCKGRRRTSELMRSLSGISPRTLSERLRELEEWGLVTRNAYAEIPPRVEYGLTEAGEEVQVLMAALEVLGSRWKARLKLKVAEQQCSHCGESQNGSRCELIAKTGRRKQEG